MVKKLTIDQEAKQRLLYDGVTVDEMKAALQLKVDDLTNRIHEAMELTPIDTILVKAALKKVRVFSRRPTNANP